MLSHAEMVQLEIQKDREHIEQFAELYFKLKDKYSLIFYEESVDLLDVYGDKKELIEHFSLRR